MSDIKEGRLTMLTKDEILALIELLEEIEKESVISLLSLAKKREITEETENLLNERIFCCSHFQKRFSVFLESLETGYSETSSNESIKGD